MNIVLLTGRLTRDPLYSNGALKFTIAIDRPKDKDGNVNTDYPRITTFGSQAENGAKYLRKGSMVEIQGRIKTDTYTGSDGKTVFTEEIIASHIGYLSRPPQTQDQEPAPKPEPKPVAKQMGFEEINDDVPF